MKLLFDQNLSRRLPNSLADLFSNSSHVRPLGMDRASDSVIFNYARDNAFVVVTQDSDFVERVKLLGPPPKIVWLRCGNTSPRRVELLLRANAASILELELAKSDAFVEIFEV